MATGLDSFEDVRSLTNGELQALVDSGRPEQRIWAIWALAMRSAEVGVSAKQIELSQEPDAALRRHLAVVLAGAGQYELLVALAKRDPAPEVRAAAMQLVARLAIDGKLPSTLVRERAMSDATEVRVAVAGAIVDGAPDWIVEIAEKLLEDRDSEVRYEAFEALVRAGRIAQAMMWLEEAPEAEARLALMRWSSRGRAKTCAETLVHASRRLRRLLVESVRLAKWQDLAPAIGDDITLVRAIARRNPGVFEEMPPAALIRATLREPTAAWLTMIRDRLIALDHPGDDLAVVLPELRDLCAKQIAECDAAIGRMRQQRDEDLERGIDYLEDQRLVMEMVLEQASRLLVH